MFENFKGTSWPAKLITIFVVGVLLGLGLCGVGASLSQKFSGLINVLMVMGAFSLWVSLLGLAVSFFLRIIVGRKNKDR
jgi:hypothetical protein